MKCSKSPIPIMEGEGSRLHLQSPALPIFQSLLAGTVLASETGSLPLWVSALLGRGCSSLLHGHAKLSSCWSLHLECTRKWWQGGNMGELLPVVQTLVLLVAPGPAG